MNLFVNKSQFSRIDKAALTDAPNKKIILHKHITMEVHKLLYEHCLEVYENCERSPQIQTTESETDTDTRDTVKLGPS